MGREVNHFRNSAIAAAQIQIISICIQIFTCAGHSATNDQPLQAIRLRGSVDRFMASREFRIFP
jgi:hypothetical protein